MMLFAWMALALTGPQQDVVAERMIHDWEVAVDPVVKQPALDHVGVALQIDRLVKRDEVTRQNLWRAFDPRLSPEEQRIVGEGIGTRMRAIDAENTEALKQMLPSDGWFRNSRDGPQATHGAWLIAQHSPDDAFRAAVLTQMRKRIAKRDVDPMDFALTSDRVAVFRGEPQLYGSQAGCIAGALSIEPMIDPDRVDMRREAIGWAKQFAETKGDLEIGKPCAM